MRMGVRFAILGDLHCPFHHRSALTWAFKVIKEARPKYVIQIGDLFDFFSLSRFPKSQNQIGMTAAEEIAEGRAAAEEMWAYIRKITPRAKRFQLLGNHEDRLKQRIREKLPELVDTELVNTKSLFRFNGVETIEDIREELVIENIVFQHGFYTRLGRHAEENDLSSVHGHTHRGGFLPFGRRGRLIWELDVGFLGDPTQKALQYTRQKWSKWTLGMGLIDELGPRFVPYPIKQREGKK